MRGVRYFKPNAGSHIPILMKALSLTRGPVAELGSGFFSTPLLHWMCQPDKRRLVTFESHPEWFALARRFATPDHEVREVADWNTLDLSESWGLVFIDHDNGVEKKRRVQELARVIHAEYVVIHDSEGRVERNYGYREAYHLFKYRFDYQNVVPNTSVLSNFHDLSNFKVGLWT